MCRQNKTFFSTSLRNHVFDVIRKWKIILISKIFQHIYSLIFSVVKYPITKFKMSELIEFLKCQNCEENKPAKYICQPCGGTLYCEKCKDEVHKPKVFQIHLLHLQEVKNLQKKYQTLFLLMSFRM